MIPLEILAIEPQMLLSVDGYWLAVTPEDAPVNVGVMEVSEDLAKRRFANAIRLVESALKEQ